MGTSKIAAFVVLALVLLGGVVFYQSNFSKAAKLNFCTWSNYYPDDLIEEFTAKTGIKVEISFISSNEELLAKFKAGATDFDLIQPSDYLVAQMIKLQMLHPLKKEELSFISHIDPYFANLAYDPGMVYSVPFTWGTTGIAINTEKIPVASVDSVGWDMLFQSPSPKKTSLLDDMREVFGAAFLWKGKSINSSKPEDVNFAQALLKKVKSEEVIFSSEPRALIERGEIDIAHIYSSDGIQASANNPKIKFFIPKEGATIYTDNFAIPKTSTRTKEAHAFINFFLDPEVAARLAVENLLATPNQTVKQKLPPEAIHGPFHYPGSEIMKRLYFLFDIGESLPVMSRAWTELKSS